MCAVCPVQEEERGRAAKELAAEKELCAARVRELEKQGAEERMKRMKEAQEKLAEKDEAFKKEKEEVREKEMMLVRALSDSDQRAAARLRSRKGEAGGRERDSVTLSAATTMAAKHNTVGPRGGHAPTTCTCTCIPQ